MEIKVLSDEKNELSFEVGSITLAEILRVYLNRDSAVEVAVWKQEHPTKNPMMLIKTEGKSPRKAIDDAVSAISKDSDKLVNEFKKQLK